MAITDVIETSKEVGSMMLSHLEGWVWKGTSDSWSLSNIFVAEMTVLNTALIVVIIYFWTVNRQAHLKNTKGSVVMHKAGGKQQVSMIDSDEEEDDDDNDDDQTVKTSNGEAEQQESPPPHRRMLNARRRDSYRAMMDYDTEADDSDVELIESPMSTEKEERPPSMEQQGLVDVVKRIKLFSYLNEDALKVCLKYVEIVDVPIGKHLFERNKYDGSLFAVISGQVRVRFHDYCIPEDEPLHHDDDETRQEGEPRFLGFTSGPGHVVTPLLAMLDALVKEQKRMNGAPWSPFESKGLSLSCGISAVATAPNTRLIRVPPRCFSAVLERFPSDVYRIAQTTIVRVQRIAVLTLVKTLGLRKELLRWDEKESPIFEGTKLPEWKRVTAALAEYYNKHNKDNNGSSDRQEELDKLVRHDAAVVAAIQLGCPPKDCEGLALLEEHSRVVTTDRGSTLMENSTRQENVYLLLRGTMEVGTLSPTPHRQGKKGVQEMAFAFQRHRKVNPGALIGTLKCFTGDDSSIFTARCCKSDGEEGCTLLRIPKHVFIEIIVLYPKAMSRCIELLFSIISPVVELLNWNSEWMQVEAAEPVADRGSPCDAMFIVLSGRLRAKYRRTASYSTRRFEEYGRGKCVGDIGGLTESSWGCDVRAIRNSELARVPIRTLVAIIGAYPAAGLHFARVIASKVKDRQHVDGMQRFDVNSRSSLASPPLLRSYGLKLGTVAVVSLTADLDLSGFCMTLVSELGHIAPTKLMTKGLARSHLGEKIYRQRNAMHDLKMTRLLAEMEENNRLVVYQADFNYTWWTKLCIQQADCILLAVNSDRAPAKKRVEQCLAWAYESMDVRIELVVVGKADRLGKEPEDDDYDKDEEMNVSDQLNNWSEARQWINGHHLVRVPFGRHKRDFQRMCRRVTGISVGLVLGGGGARGLAHLGVIKALQEAGISIDLVGGTSQGAFVGALYSKSPDNLEAVFAASREMADRMGSTKDKLLDLTLPMTSMFTGRGFNNVIRKLLGTMRIQDLVLNFFCVTTDIQRRELVVHSKGLLWKYVRASMSLTGYLPPVSEEGSLLADGGYLNVVPADVMREQFRAQTVIAVDVASESERDYYDYGMHLSGWWLLWNSWNPFVKTVKVPSMGDLSDSLSWVSSDKHRRTVVAATNLHLTPPIQEYGTLDYGKFDEIVETGYTYAKPLVDDFVKRNPGLVSRKAPKL